MTESEGQEVKKEEKSRVPQTLVGYHQVHHHGFLETSKRGKGQKKHSKK